MVKSALFKNTLRTILRSPGRYLAILGIIMLGAGFFVGLRSTKDAMIKTADAYMTDTHFYNFRGLSSLGFEPDSPQFRELPPSLKAIEGSRETDALVSFLKDDRVLHFISLPEKVNLPRLTEGRLPQAPGEVLLDSMAKGGAQVSLGDELLLSSLNSPETKEQLSCSSFTVVGFAYSPLYLNYERGTTTLGNGSVAYFAYILPEDFAFSYYTGLYLETDYLGYPYSDAYSEASAALKPRLEPLLKDAASFRYDAVRKDGAEKLRQAEDEYQKALSDFEAQKSEALEKLAEGEESLKEAKAELDSGRREYQKGLDELAKSRKDSAKAFEEAQTKLDEGLTALMEGEQAYGEGLAEVEAGEAAYAASLEQYNSTMSQYTSIFDLAKDYTAFQTAAAEVRSVLSYLMQEYSLIQLQTELSREERQELIRRLWDSNKNALSLALSSLSQAGYSLTDAIQRRYGTSPALEEFRRQLGKLDQAQRDVKQDDLGTSLSQLINTAGTLYEGAGGLMEEWNRQMPWIRQQMDQALAALNTAREQLAAARGQLFASRQELDQGWQDYFAGEEALRSQKEEAQEKMAEAEKKLAEAKETLDRGQEEYETGLKELEKARGEAEKKLAEGQAALQEAQAQITQGWQDLEQLEEPSVFLLDRSTNIGYVCLESDSDIVANVAKVFPVFFFLVAALICLTSMTRMVEEERGGLGVLLALGYGKLRCRSKFLFFAGSAALIGCGVGIPLFSFLFPQIIWQAYRIMYSFSPRLLYSLDWPLFGITTGIYVGAMLLVTWLSLGSQLSDMPAQLLRPRAPKLGKRVLLEHIPFLWNRLSFMWKVTLRNIFRYKNRVLMMLLGVAGCTALMITGHGIQDSIQDVLTYQFGEIIHYEYEVSFQNALSLEDQAAFAKTASRYAGDSLFVTQEPVELTRGNKTKTITLYAAPNGESFSPYVDLHQGKTPLSFPSAGEAVINKGFAREMNIHPGDEVSFIRDNQSYSLTVSGIFDNYVYNFLIVSDATYRQLLGTEPPRKTALVMGREGAADATPRLLESEGVINVMAGTAMQQRIKSIMDNLIYIVLLTIVSAAALAFIVIYNLININIMERLREIATVKVLGFYPAESAIYVLRENILLTGLGALLGIPLGLMLNRYVMEAIHVDLVSFEPKVNFTSFLWSIGLTLLFSLLVYLVMMRKLEKINTASALKAAE